MTFDTFRQAIARAEELKTMPNINTTGQGEPLIHPEIEKFVAYCGKKNIPHGMTTNASLLTEEKSSSLLDAGLKKLNISVSDLESTYEDVYALGWENTFKNILNFVRLNNGRAALTINIVSHEYNFDKIEKMKDFWRGHGISEFLVFNQTNRGGACKHGNFFLNNDKYFDEAEAILGEAKLSGMCSAPFDYLFLGWNGNYYICCNDYRKTTVLGNVFEYGIEEIDVLKRATMAKGIQACVDCNVDPVNRIREKLFEIEHGISSKKDLDRAVRGLVTHYSTLPDELNDPDWKSPHRIGVDNNLIDIKNLD